MATLKEIEIALRNADEAGDVEAATKLAAAYRQMAGEKQKPQPAPQERSFADSLGRQLALTARAGVGAVAAIPNMIADPVVSGINAVAGMNIPIPSQALERTMTRAGVPEPLSGTEKFAYEVNKSMGPAGAMSKVKALSSLPAKDLMLSAAGGAGASNLAEQAGFGPAGQFIAGLAGGVAAPSVAVGSSEALGAARRAIPAIIEPMTASGKERIKARALQSAARDKSSAASAATSAPEYVPGSKPTLAQASGDPGLAAQSKALQNKFGADFQERFAAQDEARQRGLTSAFGPPSNISKAEAARNDFTEKMREQAFEGAKNASVKPVITVADSILRSPAGKRQEVERAMAWVKGRLDGETDPRRLYAIRQDINDIIAGKLAGDPEKAALKLAAGELKAIKGALDNQIEKAAPGFKQYLEVYRRWSSEIDKAKLGQEIQAKATQPLAERGPAGLSEGLSPAAFTREFEKRAEEIAKAGPVASDALTRVAMDMRRAAGPTRATKTAGSDTAQNLVANNLLARAGFRGDGPVSNAATQLAGLLYRPFGVEDDIQRGLLAAHLDPKEGARLLSMPLSQLPPNRVNEILRRLMAVPVGGLLGVSAAN